MNFFSICYELLNNYYKSATAINYLVTIINLVNTMDSPVTTVIYLVTAINHSVITMNYSENGLNLIHI